MADKKENFPRQQQQQPGKRSAMDPKPETQKPEYRSGGKLEGKKAIVTGGDSGIGRAVAVAFTRSLALHLAERGIRVNAVAPGPVWTPLIPATFTEDKVAAFGANTPMKRAGQPSEIAPCYVFLASEDSSYMSGQVLHPNGGRIVNG